LGIRVVLKYKYAICFSYIWMVLKNKFYIDNFLTK
jgi:hypothetical protein